MFGSSMKKLSTKGASPSGSRLFVSILSTIPRTMPLRSSRSNAVVLAAIAAALSGCAFPYRPAEGPDLATVRFVNLGFNNVIPFESPQGDCRDTQVFGNHLVKTGEGVGHGQSASTQARPNKLFVVSFSGVSALALCGVPAGLVPEPNGEYEITLRRDSKICWLTATQNSATGKKDIPLVLIKVHRPALGPQWCEVVKPTE